MAKAKTVAGEDQGKAVALVEKFTREELAEIADENKALVGQSTFTERQLKFLDLYLSAENDSPATLSDCIEKAGYRSKSVGARSTIGRLILNKFEGGADHCDIMRRMGFGEAWIIRRLADLATTAKAESVRFQALNTMAKCIGMQKDYGDVGGGTEINIYPTEKLPAQKEAPKVCEIEIMAAD